MPPPTTPTPLSKPAYVELIKPDGSIAYGYMGGFEHDGFDCENSDPTEWGLATLITVTETPNGWAVDSSEANGS